MLNEVCKHSTPKKFYCPLCDLENQLEKKNDKLMALENILKNISEEDCTPIVKKNIETMLKIING